MTRPAPWGGGGYPYADPPTRHRPQLGPWVNRALLGVAGAAALAYLAWWTWTNAGAIIVGVLILAAILTDHIRRPHW